MLLEPHSSSATAPRFSGRPLIVDSFAGGGGASTGIEMALGRSPDIAINHNPAALALHAANHPETLHLSENIYRVDPLDHVAGKHVGLAHFSPDCKPFSKAKGGKPVERNIRDLAWVIVLWAERAKPDVITMENVEEWKEWGPLVETDRGLMPDPERRGETFKAWLKAMRKNGYRKIEWRELRACDYGAPTIRKRLFLIARRDGKPVVWPDPTHGAPDDPDVVAGRKLPWRTAAECIDWSLPCPSIFDSSEMIVERHGLRAIRPLAAATMARVARGMKRYVLDADRPFVVQTGYGERQGQAPRIMDVEAPLGTVVAGGVKHAVVSPSVIRFNTGATGQDLREPLATITANSFINRPGGAAPLGIVAPHLMTMRNAGKPFNGADEPMSTVTQAGSQQGVVSAFVSRQFGTSTGHAMDAPSATIMGDGGGKSALVAPYLQAYYGNGDGGEENQPCRTVTTKDRHGHIEAVLSAPQFTDAQEGRAREVAAFLRSHGFWDEREFVTIVIAGDTFVIVDIGMRMLTPRELYNAQGFPADYVIDGGWEVDEASGAPTWVTFPKSVQVSCVGNSVSPPVMAALVAANCPDLAEWRETAE